MAWYKYPKFLATHVHENFDMEFKPGESPPDAGIYRCKVCGVEIVYSPGTPLPKVHHTHAGMAGAVRWQMIVCVAKKF